jgi:hypothetical protein
LTPLGALTVAGAAQVADEHAEQRARGPCFPFNPLIRKDARAPTWRSDYRRTRAAGKIMKHMQNATLLLDAI